MVYHSPEELNWGTAVGSSGGGAFDEAAAGPGAATADLKGLLSPRAASASAAQAASSRTTHHPPTINVGRPGEAPGAEGLVEAALRGHGALRLYGPVDCERYGRMRLSSNMVLEHYMVSYATVLRGVLQTLD